MQCPIDGTALVMTDRSGVEIDYCPKCRGVWLDRGELDKIIERAAPPTPPVSLQEPGAAAAPAPARSRDDYRPEPRREAPGRERRDDDDYRRSDDGYGRKKRRESFLGDLFDF